MDRRGAAHQRHADGSSDIAAVCAARELRRSWRECPFRSAGKRDVSGAEFVKPETLANALGRGERPLGPPASGWITSDDFYRAVTDEHPYPVKGLVVFGANLLVSHVDTERGEEALSKLDFHVHIDLFMTPTARYADVFLPVNTSWERRALRVGFEMDEAAQSHVQYRHPVLESRGESRSDEWIAFALAERLGLSSQFWDGDTDAAYREILEPTGITLEDLMQAERGISCSVENAVSPVSKRRRFSNTEPTNRDLVRAVCNTRLRAVTRICGTCDESCFAAGLSQAIPASFDFGKIPRLLPQPTPKFAQSSQTAARATR